MVQSLYAAEIDADNYVAWAAFIDSYGVEIAGKWVATDFGPDVAGLYADVGMLPKDVTDIRARCHGDPKRHWSNVNVYVTNPYDAKGSCFFVNGIVQQLLDRTNVLAAHPRNPRLLIRANFAPRAAPAERTGFFVLGSASEPYRYTTVLGDERIVVNLDVLRVLQLPDGGTLAISGHD